MTTQHQPRYTDATDPKLAVKQLKGSMDDAYLLLNKLQSSHDQLFGSVAGINNQLKLVASGDDDSNYAPYLHGVTPTYLPYANTDHSWENSPLWTDGVYTGIGTTTLHHRGLLEIAGSIEMTGGILGYSGQGIFWASAYPISTTNHESDITVTPGSSFNFTSYNSAYSFKYAQSHSPFSLITTPLIIDRTLITMAAGVALKISALSAGIGHFDSSGNLTSSAILNTDFGNIGTENQLAKFAATGLADSLFWDNGASARIGASESSNFLTIGGTAYITDASRINNALTVMVPNAFYTTSGNITSGLIVQNATSSVVLNIGTYTHISTSFSWIQSAYGPTSDPRNLLIQGNGGKLIIGKSGSDVIFQAMSTGIGHFDVSGTLSSSPIVNSDLGNLGTNTHLAMFGATGLADTPLTSDGSTYVTVPADVPLKFYDSNNFIKYTVSGTAMNYSAFNHLFLVQNDGFGSSGTFTIKSTRGCHSADIGEIFKIPTVYSDAYPNIYFPQYGTGILHCSASGELTSSALTAAECSAAVAGTTNYLAKFTAANVVGNSLIFDNGTSVGIGTTSPGSILDIAKSTHTESDFQIMRFLDGPDLVGGIKTVLYNGNTGNAFQSGFKFQVNNTNETLIDAMTINYSGSIGIGTTAPGNLLTLGTAGNATASIGIADIQTITMTGDATTAPTCSRIELGGDHTWTPADGSLPVGTIVAVYNVDGSTPLVVTYYQGAKAIHNGGFWMIKGSSGHWYDLGNY